MTTQMKKNNGIDRMSKRNRKHNLFEYRNQVKTIKRKLKDKASKAEAQLLLHTLIFHFDGFARQQTLINEYMSSKYHWGNKRTARVLRTLAEISVIDRSRSSQDNWTLFFLVRGFLNKCKKRIERAILTISERMNRYRLAIISITCKRGVASGT